MCETSLEAEQPYTTRQASRLTFEISLFEYFGCATLALHWHNARSKPPLEHGHGMNGQPDAAIRVCAAARNTSERGAFEDDIIGQESSDSGFVLAFSGEVGVRNRQVQL